MSVIETHMGIQYKIMQKEHIQEAIDLNCEIFGKHEPAGKEIGITSQMYRDFLVPFFDIFLKQQLSVVAIDEETGKIAGFFGGWDMYKLEKEIGFCDGLSLFWKFYKKYREHKKITGPLFSLFKPGGDHIDQMVAAYAKKNSLKSKAEICLELALVSVNLDFTGKGIATNMTRILKEIGQKQGYKIFWALCSSEFSKRAVEKEGGKVEHSVLYKDFQYKPGMCSNPIYPFRGVKAPHTGAHLVVINFAN